MKELMDKVEERFLNELRELTKGGKKSFTTDEIERIYTKIERDTYLEFVSLLMERRG
jgi:hypothetical protein